MKGWLFSLLYLLWFIINFGRYYYCQLKHPLLYFFLFLINASDLFAQNNVTPLSNARKKRISTLGSIITIDTLSIIPNTLIIQKIPADYYFTDNVNATIHWLQKPLMDSVDIEYRIFPIKLNAIHQHLNYELYKYNFIAESSSSLNLNQDENSNSLLDFGSLNSSGSIARGISFGNNQDAIVNSNMNLQLSGMLGDSLELTAAISDNNLPVQPDGNTRNLRDFDRIFLQLKKKNWKLNLGDIELMQNQMKYIRFNKRIQGVSISSMNQLSSRCKNNILFSAAVAKGKYVKNIITPIEGIQGPYKLKGNNNEFYFIVLAGSERVYIDGESMQRGENQDYTIDYNTAEIKFTPKRQITKDIRIQVEFEYSDRNYLNAQYFFNDKITVNEKLDINLGVYTNADSKNSSIDQTLENKQKIFLAGLGDSIQNAFTENAFLDTIGLGKILYKKIDTFYNNTHDSIYIFSNNNADILYNLSFTYVGTGKGNYKQIQNGVNGKIYQWQQPGLNFEKYGDWEPVTFLVTPKKQHIYSLGIDYKISNRSSVKSEVSLSNYDVNLFSEFDKQNNKGIAAVFSFDQRSSEMKILNSLCTIQNKLSFEYVQKQFKPLERLRDIEFLRNWSLSQIAANSDEMIAAYDVSVKSKKGGQLKYLIENYRRSDGYNGLKNTFFQNSSTKYFKLKSEIRFLTFSDNSKDGLFLTPQMELIVNPFKKSSFQIGSRISGEYNKLKSVAKDSLLRESYAFSNHEFFWQSESKNNNKCIISYYSRTNYIPHLDSLIATEKSDNYRAIIELLKSERHQIRFNSSYREMNILRQELTAQKKDKNLTGRMEYYVNEMNGLLNGNFLYELGGGQEQKREYSYLQVPAGQGVYAWNDYNGNGLEELNEFEIAVFQDQRKYIRVFTPTNQYVKANYVQLNYSIEINPSVKIKRNNNYLKKILSNLFTSSSLQLYKKAISNNHFLLLPNNESLSDTNLVSVNSFLSNSFFYNRNNSKWGLDINSSNASGKSILSFGNENSRIDNISGRFRMNIFRNISGTMVIKNIKNTVSFKGYRFENRNYSINQNTFEPNCTYLYKSLFRTTLTYSYTKKQNKIDSMEKSLNNSWTADFKLNLYSNTIIGVKCSYNQIKFSAYKNAENSTVGYLMLEGLTPGKNILWNIDLIKRFAGNLELNVQYEGRKPGNGKIINIGRASIRAIF